MKRYKVKYWNREKSKPHYLVDFTKSGKWDGVQIWFYGYKKKCSQYNLKNGLANGIYRSWYSTNLKNGYFRNYKKDNEQGIKIDFKN